VAAGLVVAWVGLQVRRRLEDPLLGNTATALIPFTAYLLAESVDASGVLAVVTAGLILSQVGPRVGQAATRRQAEAFWSLGTFWLNGALFVLVGLELQSAVRGLTSVDVGRGLVTVLVVSVVLVVVRIAFLFVAAYAIRALDRRPAQRLRRVSHRSRIVSGLAGFRGAVSLAAALAVPVTVDSGAPFPNRDMVVFVTAGVIVVTLFQGLVLPRVVRWARLPKDTRVQQERLLAETAMAEEALALMPELAAEHGSDPAVVDRLREEFARHLQVLNADSAALDDDPAVQHELQYSELRLALIAGKRATLIRLRDERRIDDIVLRQVQSALDVEEVRLTRREAVE
jgi:CPA1 family monovalent cation:H+ antiporter